MSDQQPVEKLNEHDVLFGRGSGTALFAGNKRFRSLIEDHKPEYSTFSKYAEKNELATRLFQHVHSLGGRFLRLDESAGKCKDIVKNGVWYEVKEKEALEKIKQSLRQKEKEPNKRRLSPPASFEAGGVKQADETVRSHPSTISPDVGPLDGTSSDATLAHSALPLRTMLPLLSPTAMYPGVSIDDPRLMLFQSSFPSVLQQQHAFSSVVPNTPNTIMSSTSLLPETVSRAVSHQQGLPQPSAVSPFQRPAMCSPIREEGQQRGNEDALGDLLVASREISDVDKNQKPSDEDASEFLLSVLQLSGLPRFTDHEEEKANMSDEERAAALSDVFGKYCSVDIQKSKRARRDLDPESIAFLVKHMRNDIAKVPNDEKQALVEAKEKCKAEEFSDARLERFLRCVGMDVSLATQRFVKYWKMRRELFGPDKFTLPMTMSGALSDDLVALETGWFRLLPKCDSSGRQLLCLEPARHTREGYTSESLIRAGWYVIEVASQSNANIVCILWDKESTMFDFDRYVYETCNFLEGQCWPVKFESFHVCCTPKLVARVLLPVVLAFQSKQSRTRSVIHDVPHEEILSALSMVSTRKCFHNSMVGLWSSIKCNGLQGEEPLKWRRSEVVARRHTLLDWNPCVDWPVSP